MVQNVFESLWLGDKENFLLNKKYQEHGYKCPLLLISIGRLLVQNSQFMSQWPDTISPRLLNKTSTGDRTEHNKCLPYTFIFIDLVYYLQHLHNPCSYIFRLYTIHNYIIINVNKNKFRKREKEGISKLVNFIKWASYDFRENFLLN